MGLQTWGSQESPAATRSWKRSREPFLLKPPEPFDFEILASRTMKKNNLLL
jgi:hypothetical protein